MTQARPVVGVGAVVWRGDEVLMVRRGHPPAQGQWHLPGGKQQLGETVAETAAREVREETAVEIRVLDLAGVVDSIHHDQAGNITYHFTIVDMVAEWVAGEAVAGDDAEAVAWVPAARLESFGATPATLRIVALAAARRAAMREDDHMIGT